ncbi:MULTISPECIES: alpha-ketoacid dehydrogenase subunit beta [unclassified Sphingomonas]|uniref:alpha-ketoacid dehydrogenase subunit beta n=1 Tax=unclassified Sphingomonas TaxID=196159 RepID=UPI0006F41232|nr:MULTISPECIES: alpha-ketoacid dehydrogenase subunit beta [unclassified Sphingomonas]KQX18770.1 pyruvate dehydrogenase [Sphingomonas sp. Root1294]KQY71906.1 pyruvate dehydrogenase [Sphingomonas sp. Root50]KRB94830.1 pyruvate dehydrogenase [Sphingomonas sp. Root720]
MSDLRFAHAINRALDDAMASDPGVLLLGEDIANAGGTFAVTRGLLDKYGADRVIDMPIAENAIAGMAVGLALGGFKPVIEIMFMDFMTLTMDALVNQAAKLHFMFGGQSAVPMVVRTQHGGGLNAGPQHSQCLEAWFAHIPGLKVVVPSTLDDAYALLRGAIDDPNPVVFIENKALYPMKGVLSDDVTATPLGKARIARAGSDVTIVSYGAMVHQAMAAADQLAGEGVSAEVIDLRTVQPWDEAAVLASLAKTHRLVVAHEAVEAFGVGAEIAARMAQIGFDELDGPIMRVGAPFMPVPFGRGLEVDYMPTARQIVEAVRATDV